MNIPEFKPEFNADEMFELDDATVLSKMLEAFTAMSGSSGFIVALTDMDGRPWVVTSACRDESGVDTMELLTEAVMGVVDENWPPDDKVDTYIRNDVESTKANIKAAKLRKVEREFNNNPLKS